MPVEEATAVPPTTLRLHAVRIEPLTPEAFAPFGVVLDPADRPPDRRTLAYDPTFEVAGKTRVAVIWQPYQGRTFTQMERHFAVTQAFIPMSGALSVVAVAAPTDLHDPEALPRPADVRAFLIDGTAGFRYHVGTWHSLERFVLHPPGATFTIINVEPNPTQIVDYAAIMGVGFEVVL